ncbi:AlpA family phage regulatory protein [Salmonella enterica]|nr:AlpA family phage regulatory protein [Salmonella enterica]ELE2003982.1 AlpA family phage regulatory protein [Salmonella enterica]ELE9200191.1 AlpA family phage regulatory protein [Salmonella enterica]
MSDTDLINIKEVERSVGLKKSSIYERISNNEFPKPKKLRSRTSRWVRGEVEEWKKQFL